MTRPVEYARDRPWRQGPVAMSEAFARWSEANDHLDVDRDSAEAQELFQDWLAERGWGPE